MEVHGKLGNGFLEAVYQEAFAIELSNREILFRKEVKIPVKFKGQTLAAFYVADFICFDEVIVELKAKKSLTGEDDSQVINYLKATGHKLGLLINFGQPSLQYRRLIF